MKPLEQWQDGDELRLPTGETITVRSVSEDGDHWWSLQLPSGAIAKVYPDDEDGSVSIDVHDRHDSPLSVYWTGERAELGYVPLCVCGNDGCNDSTLAFGAINAGVWFRPEAVLHVLAVLARMPRTAIQRREEDIAAGQPQETVWLGVLDDAGAAVLQRRVSTSPPVEPGALLGELYETVATRPLDDLVER